MIKAPVTNETLGRQFADTIEALGRYVLNGATKIGGPSPYLGVLTVPDKGDGISGDITVRGLKGSVVDGARLVITGRKGSDEETKETGVRLERYDDTYTLGVETECLPVPIARYDARSGSAAFAEGTDLKKQEEAMNYLRLISSLVIDQDYAVEG